MLFVLAFWYMSPPTSLIKLRHCHASTTTYLLARLKINLKSADILNPYSAIRTIKIFTRGWEKKFFSSSNFDLSIFLIVLLFGCHYPGLENHIKRKWTGCWLRQAYLCNTLFPDQTISVMSFEIRRAIFCCFWAKKWGSFTRERLVEMIFFIK